SIHFAKIGAQPSRKPPDAATKIENPPIGASPNSTNRHEIINLTMTGGKEFHDIPPPKLLFLVAQNRPEWVQFREVFPLPLCCCAFGDRPGHDDSDSVSAKGRDWHAGNRTMSLAHDMSG